MGWVIINGGIVECLLRNPTNANLDIVLPLNLDDKFMKWLTVDPWGPAASATPWEKLLSQRVSWNQPSKCDNVKVELVNPQNYLDLLKLFNQKLTNCDTSYESELSAPTNQICPMIYLEPDDPNNPQKFTLNALGKGTAPGCTPADEKFANPKLKGLVSCPIPADATCTSPSIPTGPQSYGEIQDFLYSNCSPSTPGAIINNLDKVFTNITFPPLGVDTHASYCQYSYESKPKINFPNEFQYCNNTWPPVIRTPEDGSYIKVEKKMNDVSKNTYDLKIDRPYSLCHYNKEENTTCEMRCGSGGTEQFPFAQYDDEFSCNCDAGCKQRGDCCGGDWEITKKISL